MIYSDIRSRARQSLAGRWALSIAISALALLLGGILTGNPFLPEISFTYRDEHTTLETFIETYVTVSSRFGGTIVTMNVLGFALFILGGVIQLGYAKILLKQQDGDDYSAKDLFSEFDRFGQGFAQKFLRSLYVLLWSLLFIIPGIIKGLSYSMTPFIMADHPELSAREAIDRSAALMDGYKRDLFFLRLTFIGWDIVAAFTMNIGNLVLNPYKNAAEAAFYRQIASPPKYTAEP